MIALGALVVLSPVLLAIAVWVLAESGRPVLLRQARAGRNGRPFRMLKFRTMVADAIDAGRRLGLEDPYGIVPGDPRITRAGRILRRTGLDELPQLWNVLRGEMSIVGPRPDLVAQADRYTDADRRRLAMRPGITGWSQVQGRDEIPWPVRFRQDAWYVEHWSLLLDVKILARTLRQLARPEPNPAEDRMNIERARPARDVIVEVPPDEWDALLERLGCRDAYLLGGYVEASCVLDGGRPTLLRAGDAVFACSLRAIPGSGREDVTTPYGYGGPVGRSPGRFWTAYERWCAERAVVATFVRFHPLFGNHRAAPPAMRLERLADTTSWALAGTGDLLESMHRHHRRVARKAGEAVTIRIAEAPETLAGFAGLYEETMRRRDADEFYLFPATYWDALGAGLRPNVVVFEALDEEGVAAAILCLATPPRLHYHLGASSERARGLGAMTLLMLAAARWGREHRYADFHLGGGVGGSVDSLWEFKRRFAPEGAREMWVGKLVHDARAYAELAGTDDVDGWFPAYRRPAAREARIPVR